MRRSTKKLASAFLAGVAPSILCSCPAVAKANAAAEASQPAPAATSSGQAARPSATPNTGGGISSEEIVITAQKRDESLLRVPMSVTAIKSDALISQNLVKLSDYASRIPGLTVNGNQSNYISIRGINTGPGSGPTVAVTVDDVPFGSTTPWGKGQFPDLDPSDLQQIEVLRGPQGTLYGAASLGGLIKFVTRDADPNHLSGRVEASAESATDGGTGYGLRAAINVPLVHDVLGIRASVYKRHDPSLVDMYSRGAGGPGTGTLIEKDADSYHYDGYRVAAYFHPLDAVTINVSHLQQIRNTTNGGSTVALPQSFVPAYTFYANENASGFDRTKLGLTEVRADVDLGAAKLTSVSGWGRQVNNNDTDSTTGFGFILGLAYPTLPADTEVRITDVQTTAKFSQEVRLASTGHGKLDWLVGGFYTVEHSDLPQAIYLANSSGGFINDVISFPQPSVYREKAGFADLTYHFTPKFDLQIGGRYSSNKQSYGDNQIVDPPAAFLFGPTALRPLGYSKDNSFTWLVTPTYRVSPNFMIYARVATGYRPGGPNAAIAPTSTYGADRVINFEVGSKGRALNGMLTYDADLFDIEWRNIQLLATSPQFIQYFVNGRKARSRGLEAEGNLNLGSGFHVTGNLAVTDAKLVDSVPVIGVDYVVANAGDRLPAIAKFTSNLGFEKDFNHGPAKFFVGANWNYIGRRLSNFKTSNYPAARSARLELPSYNVLDLRTGAHYRGFDVTLFARNVTNRHGIIDRGDSATNPNTSSISVIQPRTIGADVAFNF